MLRLRWLALFPLLLIPAAWGRDGDPVTEAVLKQYAGLGKVLSTLSGEDKSTPEHRQRMETIALYAKHQGAIASFDLSKPESVQPAVDALKALYSLPGQKDGNFKNIHWILQKTEVISPEQSKRIAAVRNEMVRQICHQMAVDYGEIHKVDFSPAKDGQSDIDHTFRPAPGSTLTGEELRDEFNRRFAKKFEVPAGHLDVVSHPFEARIPDWRQRAQVDDFVLELRRGSALLMGNEEAYFLEGAFRMQVDRRGFEGKDKKGDPLELYVIYHHNPKLGEKGSVGEFRQLEHCTVNEQRQKVSERVYDHVRPETRESYAMGVSVGNWYFYHHHVLKDPAQAVRFAAKYGLRSFGEGPGYIVLKGKPGAAGEALPRTYEELVKLPAERAEVVEEVYRKHYEARPDGPEGPGRPGVGLTLQEVKDTLDQALRVRNAEDYNAEREKIFGASALLLAGGDAAVYGARKSEFLKAAEGRFEQRISKIMIQNIEATLPMRMKDWLKPELTPARIGIDPRHLEADAPPAARAEAQAKLDDARKRLRSAALFELVVAVNRLEPDMRSEVFSRIYAQHKADESFCRALATLQKVAAKPPEALTLLQTDEQARRDPNRKKNKGVTVGSGKEAVTLKTESGLVEVGRQIAAGEAALKKELEALRSDLKSAGVDVHESRATAASRIFTQSVDLSPGSEARRIARATVHDWKLQSMTREDRETWSHLTALHLKASPNLQALKTEFIDNALSWGSVDSIVNIIRAYRGKEGGDLQGALTAGLTEAANMLPLVSQGVQLIMLSQGDTSALMGLGVAGVGFICPGIGQVYMAYSIASNSWQLVSEIAHDEFVRMFWQADIPGKDGRVQPRQPGEPPSILADAWEDLKRFREERQKEIRSLPIPDRREQVREELDRLWPDNIVGVENRVFALYDAELDLKLDPTKRPEERDAIKFGDLDGFQMGDEDGFDNLPIMARTFFARQFDLYLKGEAPYEACKPAMADVSIRDQVLFNGPARPADNVSFKRVREETIVALTIGYRDALRERMDKRPVHVRIPLLQGAESFLKGRAGRTVPLSRGAPVNVPDLPSILLPVPGATYEEKQRNFFDHYDRLLNDLLERKGIPEADRDRFKAGLLDKEAPPLEDEQGQVRLKTSPVLQFFKGKVKAYRARFAIADAVMTEAMEVKLAERLALTYKRGLVRRMTERHNENRLKEEQLLLQLAAKQASIPAALAGDEAERLALLRELAMNSGDAVFFDDKEEKGTVVDKLVDQEIPAAEVKIRQPEGILLPGAPLKLSCEIKASRHFHRPFRVEWSYAVTGKEPKAAPTDAKTNLQLRSMLLGNEFDPSVPVMVTVLVKDALGVDVGKGELELGRKSPGKMVAEFIPHTQGLGIRLVFRDWYLESMFASPHLKRYKRQVWVGAKKVEREFCRGMVRVDYDNRTAYRYMEFPLPPTEAEAKEYKQFFTVGIDRLGVFPCKLAAYAGPPGTPSWTAAFQLSCKEGDYVSSVENPRATIDYCRTGYENVVRAWQTKPDALHPVWAWQWKATEHRSAVGVYGWSYYLSHRAEMEKAEEDWIGRVGNLARLAVQDYIVDRNRITMVNTGSDLLSERVQRLLLALQVDAAERFVARLEASLDQEFGRQDLDTAASGQIDLSARGVPRALRWSYSRLIDYYAYEARDLDAAARVVERMVRSGVYKKASDIDYYRNTHLKKPDNSYYPPEAYR